MSLLVQLHEGDSWDQAARRIEDQEDTHTRYTLGPVLMQSGALFAGTDHIHDDMPAMPSGRSLRGDERDRALAAWLTGKAMREWLHGESD